MRKVSSHLFLLLISATLLMMSGLSLKADEISRPTMCNPMNLPYRFELLQYVPQPPSHRTAADPTAIYFQGEYWIFPSRSGGYWHSPDFLHWSLVEPKGLDLEAWAPTVEAIDGHLFFTAKDCGIYTTEDPLKGDWHLVSKGFKSPHDGDLFLDDDGRLYLYGGCSNCAPIRGVELDRKNFFQPLGKFVDLLGSDTKHRGWEGNHPCIEGAWMNKFNGRYYLQYATPGAEYDNYGDGVFVSDHPLGPFTYESYSPFSLKATGFARGAGHSSTFKDAAGHYWHIATITISRRHMFERRLGVYPAKFFPDGQLACNTYLGDYPQYPPGVATDPFTSNSPGWMLLSLKKSVTASSELPKFPARQAVDENLHTWWSATTGNPGEWLKVDLGTRCRIHAIQVNFADQDAVQTGRLNDAYKYLLEVSDDGAVWTPLVDRKNNTVDMPHDYIQLDAPVMGRYLRITNVHMPASARFSISGLRVFGNALGSLPAEVKSITAKRNADDPRRVHVSWAPAQGAEFYIVRYGTKADRLYTNFQVYGATDLDINLLNSNVGYFFAVDAINASGITVGHEVVPAP